MDLHGRWDLTEALPLQQLLQGEEDLEAHDLHNMANQAQALASGDQATSLPRRPLRGTWRTSPILLATLPSRPATVDDNYKRVFAGQRTGPESARRAHWRGRLGARGGGR